tara:strand:- start:75 stop:338 length:264 start_codon:yes stop_codon:yes gene_type:complete
MRNKKAICILSGGMDSTFNVVLDFKDARVMDISGVEAVDAITKKYLEKGKTIKIRHLSSECKSIMLNAGQFCTYEEDDPKYKIAYDY